MTGEQYKHSNQSPGGHPIGLKVSEEENQSYLTEKVVGRINNIVIYSFLFGVCVASLIYTYNLNHSTDGRVLYVTVGLGSLVFLIKSLEYLGRFRAKTEEQS